MNEDKALDIIAKIKADREELERAIIDVVESLYKMAACTSGRWVSADIPPSSDAPSGACLLYTSPSPRD